MLLSDPKWYFFALRLPRPSSSALRAPVSSPVQAREKRRRWCRNAFVFVVHELLLPFLLLDAFHERLRQGALGFDDAVVGDTSTGT